MSDLNPRPSLTWAYCGKFFKQNLRVLVSFWLRFCVRVQMFRQRRRQRRVSETWILASFTGSLWSASTVALRKSRWETQNATRPNVSRHRMLVSAAAAAANASTISGYSATTWTRPERTGVQRLRFTLPRPFPVPDPFTPSVWYKSVTLRRPRFMYRLTLPFLISYLLTSRHLPQLRLGSLCRPILLVSPGRQPPRQPLQSPRRVRHRTTISAASSHSTPWVLLGCWPSCWIFRHLFCPPGITSTCVCVVCC